MKKTKYKDQYEIMTQMPVEPLIARLSVPTILTMMVTNFYNMVDTAFVGKLGTSASGAVGIVFGFMAILQAIGFLFGQGSGSITSRYLGAREQDKANVTASTGLFYSFTLGIVVAVICAFNLDWLIGFLGSTETIAPYAKTYITYILIAAPFLTSSFSLNNILRFEGRASLAMVGMISGCVLNMIMDPIFMFVFDMGIAGAGLSTAISQFVSFCILISMFLLHKSQIRLSFKNISFSLKLIGNIAGTGLPSMIRQALASISTVVLNMLAAKYGDAAIAAMSISSRISFFTFSVSLGIGQGFQPVSGFNYGAGKYSRVRKAFRFGLILSEICMCVLVGLVLSMSGSLIKIFRDDPEVIEIGTRAIRILSVSQLFMPFSTMVEMQLQSTGQKMQAAILSSMRNGIIYIPALLILSTIRGLYGIEEAQPLAFVLTCIPAAILARNFFNRLPKEDKTEEPA